MVSCHQHREVKPRDADARGETRPSLREQCSSPLLWRGMARVGTRLTLVLARNYGQVVP
jgi:hypothetical protein